MQIQFTLNRKNDLSQPVIFMADNTDMEMLAADIDALEAQHPEIFEVDDLFDQLDALGRAGYIITDCRASNDMEE